MTEQLSFLPTPEFSPLLPPHVITPKPDTALSLVTGALVLTLLPLAMESLATALTADTSGVLP